ncbi:MAG: response regulator [Treponema sp.]|nr:response regulator [Treponema sp.]
MENTGKNNILIVDDEKSNLEILRNILSPEYAVYMTKSGYAAIEMAVEQMPDLILLDIIMPDMNGFDVLRALKESQKTRHIPVIIITGLQSIEDEEKGFALEAADFIHKPFSNNVVKSRVHQQIQIVNQIRALEQYAQIQAALAATEEKNKFFARMSHEMRTPLNAVIGLSEMLLDSDGLREEARENMEKVCNAGASLLGLVNDILDISKIEAGKFELVPAEYDAAGMINDTVSQNIMRKGIEPIEFILDVDENIPSRLYGDDLRIKQIVNNILSNAFKYTRNGTIELKISVAPEPRLKHSGNWNDIIAAGEDLIWLSFSVRDTGIGIRPENMDRLFVEYAQMDLSANRKIEGTGLGLSITKMMTDLMGGCISVESRYGEGSVFTVIIPQKAVSNKILGTDIVNNLKKYHYHSGKRDSKSRLSRISLPYARILLVDDVILNLDVTLGMLKPYRMKIDCATSGQAAIDAVLEEKVRYNAIFMDHMMPVMDGIEATRIIREEIGTEYARTVPIIAFTANALVENESMFLSKGFNAFISKPIDILRLDTVIKQWVRDEELEKTLTGQQIIVDGEVFFDSRTGFDRRSGKGNRRKGYDRRSFANRINGLDISKGVERFNSDWETFIEILKSFSSNTKLAVKSIHEVNKENLSDYAVTVHGIKSSCRGIFAEAAGNRAETLEKAAKAGDINFVITENPPFIEIIKKLTTEIDNALEIETKNKERPKKDKPYIEALSKLNEACRNYTIIEIEKAMNEIEAFEYEADNGLVSWLQDNIMKMNYMEISEKLSGYLESVRNTDTL